VAIAAVNQGLSIHECDPRSDIAKSYAGLNDAVMEVFTTSGATRSSVEGENRSGIFGRFLPPVRGLMK
jgi:Flp pilus assembly CpaE family ATPase